jgi:chromosome segregation ATPase
VLLAVVLCAGVSAWGQVSRTRSTTPTITPGEAGRDVKRASCVLQLDFDANRGNRGFDLQTLNALLTSTAIVDPAAEKALKLAADEWPRNVQIEVVPAGNSAVRLGVTITGDVQAKLPPNAARLLLEELSARAKVAVDAAGSRQDKNRADRLAGLEAELAAAVKELEKASAKVREARATGEGERMSGYQPRLDRDQLEINLQAQRARLLVIEAERQRVTVVAATRPSASTPLPPWPELITAREKIVATVREQTEAGRQTHLDLLQSEASLAEARAMAMLARPDRREFDAAERWQSEIVSLKASIAESEARLAAINERFPKSPATQPAGAAVSAIDVEQLRQDESAARNRVSELRQLIESVRREARSAAHFPTLIILDGKSGS